MTLSIRTCLVVGGKDPGPHAVARALGRPGLCVSHSLARLDHQSAPRQQELALTSIPAIVTVLLLGGGVVYQNRRSQQYLGDLVSSFSPPPGASLAALSACEHHPLLGLFRLDPEALAAFEEAMAHGMEFRRVVKVPRHYLQAASAAATAAADGGSNAPGAAALRAPNRPRGPRERPGGSRLMRQASGQIATAHEATRSNTYSREQSLSRISTASGRSVAVSRIGSRNCLASGLVVSRTASAILGPRCAALPPLPAGASSSARRPPSVRAPKGDPGARRLQPPAGVRSSNGRRAVRRCASVYDVASRAASGNVASSAAAPRNQGSEAVAAGADSAALPQGHGLAGATTGAGPTPFASSQAGLALRDAATASVHTAGLDGEGGLVGDWKGGLAPLPPLPGRGDTHTVTSAPPQPPQPVLGPDSAAQLGGAGEIIDRGATAIDSGAGGPHASCTAGVRSTRSSGDASHLDVGTASAWETADSTAMHSRYYGASNFSTASDAAAAIAAAAPAGLPSGSAYRPTSDEPAEPCCHSPRSSSQCEAPRGDAAAWERGLKVLLLEQPTEQLVSSEEVALRLVLTPSLDAAMGDDDDDGNPSCRHRQEGAATGVASAAGCGEESCERPRSDDSCVSPFQRLPPRPPPQPGGHAAEPPETAGQSGGGGAAAATTADADTGVAARSPADVYGSGLPVSPAFAVIHRPAQALSAIEEDGAASWMADDGGADGGEPASQQALSRARLSPLLLPGTSSGVRAAGGEPGQRRGSGGCDGQGGVSTGISEPGEMDVSSEAVADSYGMNALPSLMMANVSSSGGAGGSDRRALGRAGPYVPSLSMGLGAGVLDLDASGCGGDGGSAATSQAHNTAAGGGGSASSLLGLRSPSVVFQGFNPAVTAAGTLAAELSSPSPLTVRKVEESGAQAQLKQAPKPDGAVAASDPAVAAASIALAPAAVQPQDPLQTPFTCASAPALQPLPVVFPEPRSRPASYGAAGRAPLAASEPAPPPAAGPMDRALTAPTLFFDSLRSVPANVEPGPGRGVRSTSQPQLGALDHSRELRAAPVSGSLPLQHNTLSPRCAAAVGASPLRRSPLGVSRGNSASSPANIASMAPTTAHTAGGAVPVGVAAAAAAVLRELDFDPATLSAESGRHPVHRAMYSSSAGTGRRCDSQPQTPPLLFDTSSGDFGAGVDERSGRNIGRGEPRVTSTTADIEQLLLGFDSCGVPAWPGSHGGARGEFGEGVPGGDAGGRGGGAPPGSVWASGPELGAMGSRVDRAGGGATAAAVAVGEHAAAAASSAPNSALGPGPACGSGAMAVAARDATVFARATCPQLGLDLGPDSAAGRSGSATGVHTSLSRYEVAARVVSGSTRGGGGGASVAPRRPQTTRERVAKLLVSFNQEESEEEEAGGEEAEWHELYACVRREESSGRELVVLMQTVVTEQVEAQRKLEALLEHEHQVLESIFPRHVIEHMTLQAKHRSAAAGGGAAGTAGAGGAAGPAHLASSWANFRGSAMEALATSHACVTVLFCDIVGFTEMCKQVSAMVVMRFLNTLYMQFDELTSIYGVYKVETIGDCYMVAGGLVRTDGEGSKAVIEDGSEDALHAVRVMSFAKAVMREAAEVVLPTTGEPVQLRIGLHSGPVMSGIVGDKMPRFCLFGDTVNTASRLESTCQPGAIHVSADTRALLSKEAWEPSGGVFVKGKGVLETYVWAGHGVEDAEEVERRLKVYL